MLNSPPNTDVRKRFPLNIPGIINPAAIVDISPGMHHPSSNVYAIKLQTYTADTITIDCDNEHFRIRGGTLWDGKTLHQLYKSAYTSSGEI